MTVCKNSLDLDAESLKSLDDLVNSAKIAEKEREPKLMRTTHAAYSPKRGGPISHFILTSYERFSDYDSKVHDVILNAKSILKWGRLSGHTSESLDYFCFRRICTGDIKIDGCRKDLVSVVEKIMPFMTAGVAVFLVKNGCQLSDESYESALQDVRRSMKVHRPASEAPRGIDKIEPFFLWCCTNPNFAVLYLEETLLMQARHGKNIWRTCAGRRVDGRPLGTIGVEISDPQCEGCVRVGVNAKGTTVVDLKCDCHAHGHGLMAFLLLFSFVNKFPKLFIEPSRIPHMLGGPRGPTPPTPPTPALMFHSRKKRRFKQ